MTVPVFKTLADQLAHDFIGKGLPSIRRIAAHYGVAYRTAWRAVRELPGSKAQRGVEAHRC